MIAFLQGKILYRSPNNSVIDCAGVGYDVIHTPSTAEKMQAETARLFIHTHLREDALQLFGFSSSEERSLFRELLKVSNVGPKLAMAILSGLPVSELISALQKKDISRLQKISGVGKKTAERLVVELSDRFGHLFEQMSNHPGTARWMELESVLNNLGYQRPEIARAIKKLQDQKPDIDEIPLENLVKMSLGELGRSQRPDLMN